MILDQNVGCVIVFSDAKREVLKENIQTIFVKEEDVIIDDIRTMCDNLSISRVNYM